MSWKNLYEAGQLKLKQYSTAAKTPETTQLNLLSSILKTNGTSLFGMKYDFQSIKSYTDFVQKVPILNYQSYSPWVDRIKSGELNSLSTDTPFAFEVTGGSSGGQKLIPYSGELLKSFQNSILPWLSDLQNEHPDIAKGKAYFAISPATRTPLKTAGVLPVGLPSDAVYFGEEHINDVASIMLGGVELSGIREFDLWQNTTLAWLLASVDLSFISIWSPTFLTTLLKAIQENEEYLLQAIHDGEYGLQKNPERSKIVRACIENRLVDTEKLWPNLKIVSTWADAGSTRFYDELKGYFPEVTFQPKGLLSTEGIITFPLCSAEFPLPALTSTFLEFVDTDGQIHLVDELEENKIYQVIMTTPGGLYRYRSEDQVCCMGFHKGFGSPLPMLSFYGRGNNTLDMVGEKLDEGFIAKCLKNAGMFAALCPIETSQPHYLLLLEKTNIDSAEFASKLDTNLFSNPLYADARTNGQLGPISVVQIENAEAHYIKWRLNKGHRMADIKLPILIKNKKIADEIWSLID